MALHWGDMDILVLRVRGEYLEMPGLRLTPAQAQRVSIMAHDGLARAVRPAHTPLDGDVVFCLATGAAAMPAPDHLTLSLIGAIAADCVARALARGVYEAKTLGAMRSYRDTHGV